MSSDPGSDWIVPFRKGLNISGLCSLSCPFSILTRTLREADLELHRDLSGGFAPVVAMVQAAHTSQGDDLAGGPMPRQLEELDAEVQKFAEKLTTIPLTSSR